MKAADKRFMAWLEKQLIHECSFAPHPLDATVEYCQFCGVLRQAARAEQEEPA